jgi:competence protein ComEC
VPVAAAFVLGAALGGPSPPADVALGAAAVGVLSAGLARLRPPVAVILLGLAAAALGAGVQRAAWIERERRQEAWFPAAAASIEIEVEATVLAAPERNDRGERWLRVRLAEGRAHAPLVARLVVSPPPRDDAVRLDAIRHGDRVRVWCRLRPPSRGPGRSLDAARRRLWSQGLDATGSVKSSRLVRLAALGEHGWLRTADRARCAARASLDRSLGATTSTRAVMGAMLLGDRGLLDGDTERILRDSGLVHLLSISGLHTAITILLVVALLRRTGLSPVGLASGGLLAVLAFAAFVGWGSSVLRACAMIVAALTARAAGREMAGLPALALASALLVAAVPPLAMDLSFQLSVLATAGLLAFGPGIARVLPLPRRLAQGVGISAGAYLATAPSLAAAFGRLAPVALVANIAAGILCAACLATGTAALALGPVAAPAARWSVDALLLTARAAAAVPAGHLRVAVPSMPLVLLDAGLLVALCTCRSGRRHLAFALALATIALHLGPCPSLPGASRLEILDVGQGLSVLLRSPDGEFALVDAGPGEPGRFDAGERLVVPAILARGGRRLAILALSHGHADHIGGARSVLEDLEVGELWFPAGAERDAPLRVVLDAARERGVALRRMRRGDRATRAGWTIEVPHPSDEDRGRPINDRCLVLRLRSREGASALLPGDLEASGEASLVRGAAPVGAEALVVSHHGADGSSGDAFLRAVGPAMALVSAGAGNRFGHPGRQALARLRSAGARVYRTDESGTLSLEARASGWRVSKELQRDRDERQDEHQREPERDRGPAGIEGRHLVDEARMAAAEEQEDDEPQGVPRDGVLEDRLRADEDRKGRDRHPRDDPVEARADGEHGMPAVELPDRQQVEGGDEHADPGGAVDRAHLKVRAPVERLREEPRDERGPDEHAVRLGDLGGRMGEGEADREHGKRDREPRDRPGRRDVEQRAPRRDLALDPDDRAERPDRERQARDEVGEGGPDAVGAARDVMTHLVGAEDQHDQNRVEKSAHEHARAQGDLRTGPEPAPRHRQGDERGGEKDQVEAAARRRRGQNERGSLHGAGEYSNARRPSSRGDRAPSSKDKRDEIGRGRAGLLPV